MKTESKLLTVLAMALFLMLCIGCSKKEDESPTVKNTASERNTQAHEDGSVQSNVEGILIKDMLELWDTGQKDDAVKQFLSTQWDDPSAYRDIPVLISMSDKQWRSLPRDEQLRTTEDAMKQRARLRKVMFKVVSDAKTLASSGDTETAKKHLKAVMRHGEALSDSTRFEVVRDYGKAALGYAQEKLTSIIEQTKN
jgi:hypothetical protein